MRPTKFRGKATCSDKWVYGCYVECDGGYYIIEKIGGDSIAKIQVHPETIGQFVCADKNGKDVFAGDEVKWRPEELDELCEDEFLTAAVKGGFLVFDIEGTDFVEASHFKDIELIEKKDENQPPKI